MEYIDIKGDVMIPNGRTLILDHLSETQTAYCTGTVVYVVMANGFAALSLSEFREMYNQNKRLDGTSSTIESLITKFTTAAWSRMYFFFFEPGTS